MKCKDCEHHSTTVSSNPFCDRKKKSHKCQFPVRDKDGAILIQKSIRSLTYKEYEKTPEWCPLLTAGT